MRFKILPTCFVALAVSVLCLVAAGTAGADSSQFFGAIFTTLKDGTAVNANIYLNCCGTDESSSQSPYLNGGPQNQQHNGLPDGTYYFQVTDPSGATLLSNDLAQCRQLIVTNGRVAGSTGSCTHLNGDYNSANESTPVLLCPFDKTPNPGGEYKVWLIRNATIATDGKHLNFVDSDAKTDNFKCRAGESAISGVKYYDLNRNGVLTAGEAAIPDWPIKVDFIKPDSTSGSVTTYTDSAGTWSLLFPVGTQYTACELPVGNFTQYGPNSGATTSDTLATASVNQCWVGTVGATDTTDLNFGNFCTSGYCPPPSGERLDVVKTAEPSFTRIFKWGITKKVDETKINIASGGSAAFNYTVEVTHDDGTDSDWVVNGTIDVTNPNDFDVTGITVTDSPGDPNATCTVTGGTGLAVAPGETAHLSYSCTYSVAPAMTSETNKVTVSWPFVTFPPVYMGHAENSIGFDFSTPTTITDESVTVTDTRGGSLGTVSSTDPSSTELKYSKSFSGVAGTCTSYDNTATFTTNDTSATGSAGKEVKVCVGSDLLVTKDASPTFKRTYSWSISKDVDKTLVEQSGGTATFNYTVNAKETGFTDSDWVVKGTIHVTNPNDWEAITVNVGDAVDNGGSCTVTGVTSVSVAASGTANLAYTCTYASAPSGGTNTGTATWDKAASSTPTGSGAGTAGFSFTTPTSTVNKTVTVTDTFNGGTPTTLGTLTATDALAYASTTYTYVHIINVPAFNCLKYTNTAKIVETSQSASRTVEVCGPAKTGALTMGYWQNKNGQGIIGTSTSGVCNSATWLRQYAPFQDLGSTATCAQVATYVTNIIKAANASGAAMNAMLKAQMLASALDVYFSDPTLGGNKISAPAAVGGVTIDLTKICKMIDGSAGTGTCSGTYVNVSGAFGGATSMAVSAMLTYAASQSNGGGSVWYAQVKSTQELAKNAFDAINNQAAFAP